MAWIRLDPQELGATGAHLRDVALTLVATSRRIDTLCGSPGLGRHTAPLLGEGRVLASRVVGITETYLRQAIDIIQRAIAAVQDAQLVSVVGGTGSVATGIIGGSVVGGSVVGGTTPGWSTDVSGASVTTLGGTSWTTGMTITPGGGSASDRLGLGTGVVGGSWSTTATDAGGPLGLEGLNLTLTRVATGPPLRGGTLATRMAVNTFVNDISARTMNQINAVTSLSSSLGTPLPAQVGNYATAVGLTFTPDYGQRR